MRIYEELFILRPDAPEEDIDRLIEQLTTYIASQGGNVDKSDKWGIRKLAYRVQKRNEGFYVLLQFTTKPETVLEVERRLRVSDLVMKFQNVRIDEKLKKIEKRKKEREKRASRKPAPPSAPSVPRNGGRRRANWPKTGSSDAGRASGRSSRGEGIGDQHG
jgi:small subunit ribosomal protein S6